MHIVKVYFLGKIRKNINLSSAELTQRVVLVKALSKLYSIANCSRQHSIFSLVFREQDLTFHVNPVRQIIHMKCQVNLSLWVSVIISTIWCCFFCFCFFVS